MSQFSGQEFTPIKIYEDNGLQISSLCSSETHVYLGTVDGRIIMYEFRIEKNGIVWKEIEETFIKKKAPIIKMACWADKGLLITLSNNSIQFWTPTDLQEKPGIPGLPEKILAVGFDQQSRSKIAVVSGKSVHVFGLNAGVWGLVKLVELPDKISKSCISLGFQGNIVGVSLHTRYALVDIAKGTVTELMAFGNSPPMICAGGIGDTGEEFICVQENKGLTIEKSGSQTRQKINWSNHPASIEVMRPFIISLQPNSLEVSNIFSVTKPVTIPINSYDSLTGLSLGMKHLLAFNSTEIYCLLPMPIEKQVEQLISLNRVHDALKMYMTSGGDHGTPEFKNNLRSFHEKAAVKFFEMCNFDDAFKYFKLSDIKPRTIISFFSDYQIPEWNIYGTDVREIIRKHNADSKAEAKVDENAVMPKVLQLFCGLLEFWSTNTYKTKNAEYKLDCDITLLKVYSDLDKIDSLNAMFNDPSLKIPLGYASTFFERKQRPEPLAVIYSIEGQVERALQMFAAAVKGELKFSFVDPASHMAKLLEPCTNWDLVSEYSTILIKSHPQIFKQIFINEKRPFNSLNTDTVLSFLKPHGGTMERDYLDFIINVCHSPQPKYHILLANLLLQQILPLLQQINIDTLRKLESQYLCPKAPELPTNLAFVPYNLFKARLNLINLLKTSPHYDPNAILVQIEKTPLFEEKILVYKRLGIHEEALMIIIDQFNDSDRAEKYCIDDTLDPSKPETDWTIDTKGNPMLFSYFNVCLKASKDEPYPSKACALLDKYPNEFDPVDVLKLLPPTIPLHILKNFLTYSLKHKTHKMHHAQVLKNTTASQHMTYQLEKMELEQQKTFITYNTLCTVTGQPIRKMPFVRYPNGVLMLIPPNSDVQINETVCPKTGRDFNKKPVIGVLQ